MNHHSAFASLLLLVLISNLDMAHSSGYGELNTCLRELTAEYEQISVPAEVERATALMRDLSPDVVHVTTEQDLKVKVHLRYHLNPDQFDALTRQCRKLGDDIRAATMKHSCVFEVDLPAHYVLLKHLYPLVHKINEYAYLSTALVGGY